MDKLSPRMEDYLEAVYEVSLKRYGARLTDIAARLSVTTSTANAAMAALAERRLIKNERYTRVVLTRKGAQMARAAVRKHETIRDFLTEILQIDDAIADKDACAIEHVVSDSSVKAMGRFLKEAREDMI
jgi:Mn-dependent DtxR family transcriptional regulator